MQSKAATVDAYLGELPEGRREALGRLRDVCREVLTGYEEGMEYGMPTYKRDGVVAVAFASQVQYVSLYGLGKVSEKYKAELVGVSCGKGCLRFKKPAGMDFGVIRKMLVDKVAR